MCPRRGLHQFRVQSVNTEPKFVITKPSNVIAYVLILLWPLCTYLNRIWNYRFRRNSTLSVAYTAGIFDGQ